MSHLKNKPFTSQFHTYGPVKRAAYEVANFGAWIFAMAFLLLFATA